MITEWDPRILLGIGFGLLVIGVLLPLLMVMRILPSTFFLNFFAFGSSFLGLMLGIIGSVTYLIRSRSKGK
jgi:hypothetical protein